MEFLVKTRFLVLVTSFFIGWLLMANRAYCDEFSFFVNYTVNDGLPSSKVYDMIQDSKGFIWIATENGVSRFDGNDFRNYTVEDGLPTNSTLRLYEDYKGRIWFLSYLGPISFYENGSIHAHILNDTIGKMGVTFFADIFVDSSDNILLTEFFGGYVKISNNTIVDNTIMKRGNTVLNKIVIVEHGDNIIGWYSSLSEGIDSKEPNIEHQNDTLTIYHIASNTEHHLSYCKYNDYIIVSFGLNLFIIRNGKLVTKKHYENEITNLFCDDNGGLWINEKFRGTSYFDNYKNDSIVKTFLPHNTVSKILESHNGNYWISTTEDGVYFVPSILFDAYIEAFSEFGSNNILSIKNYGADVFFSTTRKGLFRAKIDKQKLYDIKALEFERKPVNDFNAVFPSSNNNLYVTGALYKFPEKVCYGSESLNNKTMTYFLKYGYSLTQTSKNEIVICNKGGIQIYKEDKRVYESIQDSFAIKTFCALELPNSSLLLGTIDGLYLFKDGGYTKFDMGNPLLGKRISTLDLINGEIWAGTFDYGMVVIGSDYQKDISINDGLSSNRIKTVLAENDSVIWIGTNKGLNKVETNKPGPMQITAYTIWDGLPSNEINDILLYEGVLWLATTKGLVSIDPSELKTTRAAPKLIVENIKVNKADTVFSKSNPILRYSQNNLSFTYTAINHYDPEKTSFFFKLGGLENDWRQTNAKTIHFDDLKYGDYSFKLKAKNTAGEWSNTYQFDFSINKHFTETLWFRAFVIVALFASVVLFFLFVLHRQKKRDELKRRVLVSEQKAMRSQMNPHFIFNSLNSIQDIVLNKKTGTASRFIVDFSALLRRILELSKHNMVSLSEELKTIELYLSLEKTRLSGKFDYGVSIDESIDNMDMGIPSMIIQPLLENAIWHGIAPLPKNAKAYVSVKISQAQNMVYISITDNGIGRKKSLEIEKARSFGKATGLSNINERINLANKIYKANIKLQIDDLFPEKEFTGTSVRISFAIIE